MWVITDIYGKKNEKINLIGFLEGAFVSSQLTKQPA
jgi:hypothetical protein